MCGFYSSAWPILPILHCLQGDALDICALLLFKGYTEGPHKNKGGGGSDFLCLHKEPQWENYVDGHQYVTGSIHGVEYEVFNDGRPHPRNNVFSEVNNDGRPLQQNPGPCAACYVPDRSTILMIPARTQCPDGWTKEYGGYLVSAEEGSDRKRSSYICWDEAPEIAVGGKSQNQGDICPVEVHCGSLPCSLFISGRELTCVVCSH